MLMTFCCLYGEIPTYDEFVLYVFVASREFTEFAYRTIGRMDRVWVTSQSVVVWRMWTVFKKVVYIFVTEKYNN